jgi:hypothetical protein
MRGVQFSGADSLEHCVNKIRWLVSKCEGSPQEPGSNREQNMGFDHVFDGDLLVFFISVDSYHRTQQALRRLKLTAPPRRTDAGVIGLSRSLGTLVIGEGLRTRVIGLEERYTRDATVPVIERTEGVMKTLNMGVRGGIHVPPTLRRSELAVNGRNTLMTGGANVLNRILHIVMPDDGSIVKRLWNRVARGLLERMK